MNAIINFYVKRKNPLVVLSSIFALIAAILRIIVCSAGLYIIDDSCVFWLAWLPIIGLVFFALTLFFCGQDRLYMTIIPLELTNLFIIIWSFMELHLLVSIPIVAVVIAASILYALTVTGKIKASWPLIPLFAVPCAVILSLFLRTLLLYGVASFELFSVFLITLCQLLLTFALKPRYEDGSYVRKWGDRSDGRKVRSLSPIFKVSPYIMIERNESSNFIKDTIDITEMEKYIREKRRSGLTNFGIMHVILAAYIRAISQFPGINRFINGQKIYTRDYIEVNMSIKKEMTTDSPDTVIKVEFSAADTANDIYYKMNEKIEEVKNTPLDSGFDGLAKALNFIPGLFLKFSVFILKMLDYFGLLPRALTKLSPFHGSLYITSMGSLGIPPIYHHLYNFGNVPVFCSFGKKRSEVELDGDGKPINKKYVDCTWVTDERICDGFYFASAMKYIKHLLSHPEILDTPPEQVILDAE